LRRAVDTALCRRASDESKIKLAPQHSEVATTFGVEADIRTVAKQLNASQAAQVAFDYPVGFRSLAPNYRRELRLLSYEKNVCPTDAHLACDDLLLPEAESDS
jgi:hypothetical protein